MRDRITADDFDRMECSNPDCTHEDHSGFVLSSRCHPGRGLRVAYQRRDRALVIDCAVCGAPVVVVVVSQTN